MARPAAKPLTCIAGVDAAIAVIDRDHTCHVADLAVTCTPQPLASIYANVILPSP